jgi:acetyl-CoA carboxylase carboxyl transferase subunit beta
MSIFDLFKEQSFFKSEPGTAKKTQENIPALYTQCPACKEAFDLDTWKHRFGVCPACTYHCPISVEDRIQLMFDEGTFEVGTPALRSVDVLQFNDQKSYSERLAKYESAGMVQDALVLVRGKIHGKTVNAGLFNFKCLGGSMGSVVGEKVCLLFEKALREKTPVIMFHETGGARMQEGLFSLFQMGKTSMVLQKFKKESRLPYISVLCYPTTGGVAASFGIAGDVNIAEKNALVGFAGKRVIEQAIRKPLPAGFQSAEYVFQKGMLDQVVDRLDLKDVVSQILKLLASDVE